MSSSNPKSSHEHGAFMGWGAIAGAIVGGIAGAFFGHWFIGALLVGVVGMTIGGLMDRARR